MAAKFCARFGHPTTLCQPCGFGFAERRCVMTVEIKNAVVKNARIIADNGYLDAWLDLDYGGSGQGFGGYSLYLPKSFTHHKLESVAGHFIWRCMEIAGVDMWEKMAGKTLRVKGDHGRIEAIGHIVNDDWFSPASDFKNGEGRQS